MSWFQIRANFPWPPAIAVLVLVLIGLVNIGSASIRTLEGGDIEYRDFYLKQAIWLGLAVAGFLAVVVVPYHRVPKGAIAVLYLAGVAVLLCVLAFGVARGGARRWLDLKVMLWQPSEYTKLLVIVAVAKLLQYRRLQGGAVQALTPMALTLAPVALVMLQPDLGTALTYLPVLAAMLYVAGMARRPMLTMLGLGLLAGAAFFAMALKPYQRERLTAFLDQNDPAAYHQVQGLIALASGGWSGRGWGQGTQNTLGFLPERHTDFIFSVIGEEWGLVGCSLVILCYALLFVLLLGQAARTREQMGRLILVGVTAMFFSQVLINIGMTMRLLPVTGLTLPFVSYGGSSLLACFLGFGLCCNVIIHRPPIIGRDLCE